MTIADLLDNLDTMSNEDREEAMRPLVALLSPVSMQTLRQFQTNWDPSRSFDEFVAEQNKEIRTCVEMETSGIGQTVRERFSLEPLKKETILLI